MTPEAPTRPLADWVLGGRFGSDPQQRRVLDEELVSYRDAILERALPAWGEGKVLLDLGTGDGLVGFGALERCAQGTVIFSDVSADLVDHCRARAEAEGLAGRARSLVTSADDLSALADGSVDAVTMRSVLLFVPDRARAVAEAFRVLRPGGVLAAFERLGGFFCGDPDHFLDYDVGPVRAEVDKVRAALGTVELPAGAPVNADLFDFDVEDMVGWLTRAGFATFAVDLRVAAQPGGFLRSWEALRGFRPHPYGRAVGEAMDAHLTRAEQARVRAHLEPLMRAARGTSRRAGFVAHATR